MHAAEGGTETYHVEVGIFFAEQAAFQSGMDGLYFRLLAEKAYIAFAGNAHDFALGIHLPTGITLVCHTSGSAEFKCCAYDVCHVRNVGRHA